MAHYITKLILFVFILSAFACSPERKLANTFIHKTKPGAIMLIAPDFVYKNSFKIPYMEGFDSLSQHEKDSIAFFTSDVIQYCNDSVYIHRFTQSFRKGLSQFGFRVYEYDSTDKFLNTEEESYILNIAQIQLEEYLDSISDETSYDEESQNYMSLFITAINMNNWLELSKLNHVQHKPLLLYNSVTITDDFRGNFVYYPLTGAFDYNYIIDSLDVEKLYVASAQLGYQYAQWIFDFIMNAYIRKNMPEGIILENYYTFDIKNKRVKRSKIRPFEII